MSTKRTFQVFIDLQCPYSKTFWSNRKAIEKSFADTFDFSVHVTSLLFHPQAFPAQRAAKLIELKLGQDSKIKFIDACFEKQDSFMNKAAGDARPSEVKEIMAQIAGDAGLFDDDNLTKKDFIENMDDWEAAVKPGYTEHKYALEYGVYGTPKFVIDEKLVADTESSWGADEWAAKLKELEA